MLSVSLLLAPTAAFNLAARFPKTPATCDARRSSNAVARLGFLQDTRARDILTLWTTPILTLTPTATLTLTPASPPLTLAPTLTPTLTPLPRAGALRHRWHVHIRAFVSLGAAGGGQSTRAGEFALPRARGVVLPYRNPMLTLAGPNPNPNPLTFPNPNPNPKLNSASRLPLPLPLSCGPWRPLRLCPRERWDGTSAGLSTKLRGSRDETQMRHAKRSNARDTSVIHRLVR